MKEKHAAAFPLKDKALVRLAAKKAGSLRKLQAATGFARTNAYRLFIGEHERLRDCTREKLVEYINAE